MRKRRILRGVSLVMFGIAVIFVAVAVQNPQWGTAVQVENFTVGAEVWRVCYGLYLLVMAGLFAGSFFVKGGR